MGGKITRKTGDPEDERRTDELDDTFAPRSMRRYKKDPSVKALRNTELVVVDDGGNAPYVAFRLDWKLIRVVGSVSENVQVTNLTVNDPFVLPDFTANRLVSTDDDKILTSVLDLTEWIAGTASEITVTDDGDGTITLSLATPATIHHLIFTVSGPLLVQNRDNEVGIWRATDADLTISELSISLDAAGNEVAGDLKYADAFIGLANPVVINAFDTTSGVLVDSSITVGAVPSGKCLYLSFDSAPNAAITQMLVDITFTYD